MLTPRFAASDSVDGGSVNAKSSSQRGPAFARRQDLLDLCIGEFGVRMVLAPQHWWLPVCAVPFARLRQFGKRRFSDFSFDPQVWHQRSEQMHDVALFGDDPVVASLVWFARPHVDAAADRSEPVNQRLRRVRDLKRRVHQRLRPWPVALPMRFATQMSLAIKDACQVNDFVMRQWAKRGGLIKIDAPNHVMRIVPGRSRRSVGLPSTWRTTPQGRAGLSVFDPRRPRRRVLHAGSVSLTAD